MRLRVGAGTDPGRVRHLNEDAYIMRADEGLFVVCDGMGGAPAGEVASQMAVEAILRQVNGAAHEPENAARADASPYLPHTSRLADAVRRSNEVIYDQARRDPRQAGMGTTVVGAWIRQHIAGVAHVGDSRAYLWHDDRLEPLTRDHSLGIEHQHVLVRVLGREPHVDVDLKEVAVHPGDYVLLCSDGLTRMVPEPVLAQAIFRFRDPQRICDYLIAAANSNGGADNITVVVVEVAGNWWRRLVNRWTRSARRGHDAEAYAAV
ncbi:MAG: protein phosphatase 2C domain-containing protein [Vicinamibacterales bacterium]